MTYLRKRAKQKVDVANRRNEYCPIRLWRLGKVIPTMKLPPQLAMLPIAIAIGRGPTWNNSVNTRTWHQQKKNFTQHLWTVWIQTTNREPTYLSQWSTEWDPIQNRSRKHTQGQQRCRHMASKTWHSVTMNTALVQKIMHGDQEKEDHCNTYTGILFFLCHVY